jgi:hypothetical protein
VRKAHRGLDDFHAKTWKPLGQAGADFLDPLDLMGLIHAQSIHQMVTGAQLPSHPLLTKRAQRAAP